MRVLSPPSHRPGAPAARLTSAPPSTRTLTPSTAPTHRRGPPPAAATPPHRGRRAVPPPSRRPHPLRAADSDDPSDDDDPAAELTPDELAMALADLPQPVVEAGADTSDDDDEDSEWDLSPSAFDGARPVGSGAAATDADDASDARALALALAAAVSGVKASDVAVLHVAPLVYWTSYMVLATVTSRPQLSAVLARCEAAAAASGRDLDGARNPGRSAWEVLDFGDVVLHVFTPDQREFYDLEGFYGGAEEVPLPAEAGGGGVEWATERAS